MKAFYEKGEMYFNTFRFFKDLETNGKHRILATSCRDVLEEYLAENQHLDVDIKNNARLVIKNRK